MEIDLTVSNVFSLTQQPARQCGTSGTLYFTHSASVVSSLFPEIYGNINDATSYFSTKLFVAEWEDSDYATRYKALCEATRRIEVLAYRGRKLDVNQTLFFPRYGIETRIPRDIIVACYEIALALLKGVDPEFEISNQSLIQQGYAGVTTKYVRDFALDHFMAGIPSAMAFSYLRPYLSDPQNIKLRRGV